jgi:hypothetical protein
MPAASSLVFATALAGSVYDRHATPPADGGDGPAMWCVNTTCSSTGRSRKVDPDTDYNVLLHPWLAVFVAMARFVSS